MRLRLGRQAQVVAISLALAAVIASVAVLGLRALRPGPAAVRPKPPMVVRFPLSAFSGTWIGGARISAVGSGWAFLGGHMVSPRLIRTSDGGRHWIESRLPQERGVLNFDLHGTEEAWVLSRDHVARSIGDNGGFLTYHTTDGGRNWTAGRPFHLSGSGSTAFGFAGPFGWAAPPPDRPLFTLYTTSDGGVSWRRIEQPAIPANALTCDNFPKPEFNDSRSGWLPITACPGGVTPLLHTTDGGRNWSSQLLTSPPGPSIGASAPYSGSPVETISFLNRKLGYFLRTRTSGPVGDCVLYITSDAGETWISSTALPAPCSYGGALSSTAGWVVLDSSPGSTSVNPSLYRTADGGMSWALTAHLPGQVTDLHFADANNGWATIAPGAQGSSLYSTKDGGRTWTDLRPIITLSPNPF